ncbi:unnamed protein product [Pleuronectes platessa]|uniref:Uncharacterized protein n=1 Tax=Pleuronectes platessa TaxID=8262 RepID=A0A9N7U976_PLEPL|nr:unnamed protein product [Pleuronectes platessa]
MCLSESQSSEGVCKHFHEVIEDAAGMLGMLLLPNKVSDITAARAMRQIPLEDDKETSEPARILYSLCLSSAADCGALAGWLAGWLAGRPAGTTETQWHRAGTNVNLR